MYIFKTFDQSIKHMNFLYLFIEKKLFEIMKNVNKKIKHLNLLKFLTKILL